MARRAPGQEQSFIERQAVSTDSCWEGRLPSFGLELTLVWVRSDNFLLPSLTH